MQSGMAASRAHAHIARIKQERERIIDAFAANPHSTHRAVTKVTKSILLNGPYLFRGNQYDIKAKSLGAGIYELSLIQYAREAK